MSRYPEDQIETTKEFNSESLSYLQNSLSVLTNTATKMSEMADKGPTSVLISLGSTITLFALMTKINIFGLFASNMNTIEFTFLLVTGWLFLGAASLIKFLQYKDQQKMRVMIWETGQKQLINIRESQQKGIDKISEDEKRITGQESVKL